MYPSKRFWRRAQRACHENCDDHGHEWHPRFGGPRGRGPRGPGFGVRRPLRFLARHLDLDEKQVAELAKIISELKTERAQAKVDDRRAAAKLADALAGHEFDKKAADEAGAIRVAASERLRSAISTALERMHAALDDEQRAELAYLIRTGGLHI